jgi:hypothetical protein
MDTDSMNLATGPDLAVLVQAEIDAAYKRGYEDGLHARSSLNDTVDTVVTNTDDPFFAGTPAISSPTEKDLRRTFTLATHEVRPNFPSAIRFEANRPLSKSEIIELAHMVAYLYRSTVRGDGVGRAHRDSTHSFWMDFDTLFSQRTDPMAALDEFECRLDESLLDGTPVRKTDKAGPGTKGTRAVYGLNDPHLRVAVYYDSVKRIVAAA